jgi:hypothetical protein
MLYWKQEREGAGPTILNTEVQTDKARMAYAFADHMILAVMQRQTIQELHENPHPAMSMQEISKRACDLAEALWAEMKRREFVVEFPAPEGWTPID